MIDFTTVLIGIVVFLTFYLLMYLARNHGSLESLGIPVVPPFLCFGSPPFRWENVKVHELDLERMKKYGKTWGLYDGTNMNIFTMDPEILKTVMIKDFANFSDRQDFGLPDKYNSLDVSGGDTWRVLRKSLSPTFTSGKLKAMIEPIESETEKFVQHMEATLAKSGSGKPIDFRDKLQAMGINVISKCAFGIEINALEDPNDRLFTTAKKIFSEFSIKNFGYSIMWNLFLHLDFLKSFINLNPEKEMDYLRDLTVNVMKSRDESSSSSTRGDFTDRLRELKKQLQVDPELKNFLNEDMITAQGIIFLTAGFETTSNTLGTVFYNLAKHQDLQEKVHEEIVEVLKHHDGKINHDSIADMHYLEAFISEDLRLFTPVIRNQRRCMRDTKVGDMVIKEGTIIVPPVYAMHRNPEFFPDPEAFRPERFLPENAKNIIPLTYHPFGGGQRICIGMRFAMIEMKMTVAKMLTKFKVLDSPETKLDLEYGNLFLLSYPEMKLRLERR